MVEVPFGIDTLKPAVEMLRLAVALAVDVVAIVVVVAAVGFDDELLKEEDDEEYDPVVLPYGAVEE